MSNFVPSNYDSRTSLIFCFKLKKSAAEAHRMLVEAYGEHAIGRSQCFEWFNKFKSGDFDRKVMLCVFWVQAGIIYYELLQPGETVNSDRYRQQLIELNRKVKANHPEYDASQPKPILYDDNAPPHRRRPDKGTVELLGWEQLPHAAYSPDLAPSDYHLFASMGHALAEQRFNSHQVENWLDACFAFKPKDFFWLGIHKLPERWTKSVASEGNNFK